MHAHETGFSLCESRFDSNILGPDEGLLLPHSNTFGLQDSQVDVQLLRGLTVDIGPGIIPIIYLASPKIMYDGTSRESLESVQYDPSPTLMICQAALLGHRINVDSRSVAAPSIGARFACYGGSQDGGDAAKATST